MNNCGIKNEEAICRALDCKTFKEISPSLQRLLSFLFTGIDEKSLFFSNLYNRFSKPDILISYQGKNKYLSIKCGRSDSVHFENIKSFILFLRSLGVSVTTQKTLLLFFYGDGTLDGSGTHRESYSYLSEKMKDPIAKANQELNQVDIIKAVATRCVIFGTENRRRGCDALYFGDCQMGTFASSKEIVDFCSSRKSGYLKTIHFGPLTFQPFVRKIEEPSYHGDKSNRVQIKWHYMLSDLQEMEQNRQA